MLKEYSLPGYKSIHERTENNQRVHEFVEDLAVSTYILGAAIVESRVASPREALPTGEPPGSLKVEEEDGLVQSVSIVGSCECQR